MKKIVLFLFILNGFSCSKKNDPSTNLIDPKDANKLMEVIITPAGGETKQSEPPKTSIEPGTLEIKFVNNGDNNVIQNSPQNQSINTYQGTNITIITAYSCNDKLLNGVDCAKARGVNTNGVPYCVFRVKGSDSFMLFRYTKSFGSNGNLQFPLTLPENIGNGQFEAEFTIVDEYGLVANYTTTKVIIKRLDDKDNPSKAYGCNFEKATNELIVLLDKLDDPGACEQFKTKYNDLVVALINCKNVPEASKTELRNANNELQAIDCSVFNKSNKSEFQNRIEKLQIN